MKAKAVLSGKKVRLRPMEQTDVEPIWQMINQPAVRQWWGNETRQDVIEYLSDPEVEVWVIEHGGQFLGMIQCYEENTPDFRHAGMDISLNPEFHGKGYGVEALRLVAKYLFDRGHHRLIIDPDFNNERAVKAYAKIGYKPVGIMRQYSRNVGGDGWHDGLLMDLVKEEFIDG
jgi:aminoglycoside 6'-N-acetyltransferase